MTDSDPIGRTPKKIRNHQRAVALAAPLAFASVLAVAPEWPTGLAADPVPMCMTGCGAFMHSEADGAIRIAKAAGIKPQ
jgi:hypothetical protein